MKKYYIGLFTGIVLYLILSLIYRSFNEYFTPTPVSQKTMRQARTLEGQNNIVLTDNNGNLSSIQFPRGIIVAYHPKPEEGGVITPPDGWVLCDGNNGTPDLRGRFILGYNGPEGRNTGRLERRYRSAGGVETVTLTIEQMPKHKHTIRNMNGCCNSSGNQHGTWQHGSNDATKDTEEAGNNQPHENMPPYVALAFIMKA